LFCSLNKCKLKNYKTTLILKYRRGHGGTWVPYKKKEFQFFIKQTFEEKKK
jgi:hypothetical protein